MRGRLFVLLFVLISLLAISVNSVENDSSGHQLADDDDDDDFVTPTEQSPAVLPTNDDDEDNQDFTTTDTKPTPQIDSAPLPQSDSLPIWLRNGRLEYLCCVGLVFVVMQAFLGKRQNEQLIACWARTTKDFFNQTFEVCGFNDSILRAFGWDYFEFFASGRTNCSYCLVKLQCRPRQCPWQSSLLSFITGSNDLMDIEIPLTMPEKFSVVLGRRMQLKALQDLNKDLGSCVSLKKSNLLAPKLCVLSDNGEVIDKLFTKDVADILNLHASSIRHLIISDIVPSDRFADITPENKLLRLSVGIPTEDKMTEMIPLLQAIFYLVDNIASLTLSEQARGKVKNAREALQKRQLQETEEERREDLEKKKAQKREEELERVKNLGPEARRAWEEKQQKKQAKAMKPKMKMMKA